MGLRAILVVPVMVTTLSMALVVTTAPVTAVADMRAELEAAEQAKAEAAATLEDATDQAQEAASKFAAAEAQLPEAQLRWDEARGEVAAATTQATMASQQAEQADAALADANARVDESNEAVAHARDQVDGFVLAAYKGGGLASVNMLLDARGPVEAMQRFGYLDQVVAAERQAVDKLTSTRLGARQAENESLVAQQEAAQAHREAQDALARAQAAEAVAETAAAAAEELVDQRTDALEIAESERTESLDRFERAEAEAARVEDELRAWEARQTPAPVASDATGSGVMQMPAQGWKSSAYGMRSDPLYGVWRMHAGIDIAAAGGEPIRSAAAGKVIRAGWNGGYGLFTCLSHGQHEGHGLSTCYAHQSEILVGEGQQVEQGEVIGRIGTTGHSTGDHLHFEVRLDGAPTDPAAYLPACLC